MFTAIFTSATKLGATFLLGSTGEIINEKSGHLNLGIPGIMSIGAAVGCYVAYGTKSWISSVPYLVVILVILSAFLSAALVGLIYSFLTVSLKANQNITGLAITTFGVGFGGYITTPIKNEINTAVSSCAKHFRTLFPFYKDLGTVGELLLSYGIMIYLAIIIAIVTSRIFKKTKVGLHLRAVGENPATADAAGVNISLYRYITTAIGCGIAGLGGITYMMDIGSWENGVLEGLGWLCVALVIFTMWRPSLSIIGSFVFALLITLGSFIGLNSIGKELFKAVPYLVTIIVLIVTSITAKKSAQPPASLGLNYFREDR